MDTHRPLEGLADRKTNRLIDGCMDGPIDGCMDGWTKGQTG